MSSVIIIGGGIAGLSAGCYARMNGYDTTIFEMHNLPGGLCTAWERRGYTIDGCIHWLVGSAPGTPMNTIWQELGAVQGRPMEPQRCRLRLHGKAHRTSRVDGLVLRTPPEACLPFRGHAGGVCRSHLSSCLFLPSAGRALLPIGYIRPLPFMKLPAGAGVL